MSIQYTLDGAYFIYTTYKFDSTRHFERNLRQKLKQIALQYKMHQFFDGRTSIEENFRSSCSETMAGMGRSEAAAPAHGGATGIYDHFSIQPLGEAPSTRFPRHEVFSYQRTILAHSLRCRAVYQAAKHTQ
jgi:hypothetical protein